MGKKNRTGHIARRSLLHHALPVVVWLAVVACVTGLFYQRVERFQIVGIAQGQVRQVAATCDGRIRSVPVELFAAVKAGQTVAVIDTVLENEQVVEAQLKAELAGAKAEIEHLAAQLIPTQELLLSEATTLEINRVDSLRRFSVDVENARLRILELQATIASDGITLGDLAMEVKITEELLKQDTVAPYEHEKARVQYESLAKKTEEDEQLLAQAKADLEQAQQRRDDFAQQKVTYPSVDSALEVIRREIRVQEELMSGLLEQLKAFQSRQAVELKSPVDGVIVPVQGRANDVSLRSGEEIVRRPGEVVQAGDPILAVAGEKPAEIVAYVNEQQVGLLNENLGVELVKIREPAQIAKSRVVAVGPTIEMMPQRLWRNPNIPQWGRPVVVEIPDGLELVPGELVGIRGL